MITRVIAGYAHAILLPVAATLVLVHYKHH